MISNIGLLAQLRCSQRISLTTGHMIKSGHTQILFKLAANF